MLSPSVMSHTVPHFATPWTVAHQAPLSMGFSRQEYQSRLSFPSSGFHFLQVQLNRGWMNKNLIDIESTGNWAEMWSAWELPLITEQWWDLQGGMGNIWSCFESWGRWSRPDIHNSAAEICKCRESNGRKSRKVISVRITFVCKMIENPK